jgi:hypothetical protein
VSLGNDQRVTVGIFRHIQKSVHFVILVDFISRNIPRNNFTKYAIHISTSPTFL